MVGKKTWVSDEVLSAADLNGYLMDQSVTIWANVTARNSGILSPIKGNLTYVQDVGLFQEYSGTAWVGLASSTSGTAGYSGTSGTAVYSTTSGTAANATKVNNFKVFVQSATPTATGTGDLWFY